MADIDPRPACPPSASGIDDNVDPKTIAGFGREWTAFSQSKLGGREYEDLFRAYFGTFPFEDLPADAEGFDLGCGSGRWAIGVAARVGKLHCIDPAAGALRVARERLRDFRNVEFHLASASNIPLADGSQDFGYSLGVLHHIPDTGRAMADAVRKLKPGAPFLVYIYYNLENRPRWYRALWRCTDQVRRVVSRLHFPLRFGLTNVIAAGVYWPLARFAKLLSRCGIDASNVPLSGYRDLSFYMMRTDALDRFGTVLEKRFTRAEIESMMRAAGLQDIQFAEREPYWLACGRAGPARRSQRRPVAVAATSRPQRPRVLHVISGLGPGGAETVLYRLATNSGEYQHEVVSLGRRDWYSSRLEERGVTVRHIRSDTIASAVPGILRLYHFIRRSRPDLVQGWMYRGNVMAGVCGRMAGLPVLWNIRCSTLAPLRLGSRLLARVGGALAGWMPEYVINCSVQSAHLHAALGYNRAKGGVIANGYDPEIFRPDEKSRAALRSSLNITDGFLLGSIGRWHPQKGLPELLMSLRLVVDRGVPARLVLIGRGLTNSNAHLVRLIKQSGTEELVTLLGERADIPEIARLPDLHVLASIGTEGFPNVVAETMLCGTPNVSTEVGDAPLIVGNTGWIVEPADPAALADAIAAAYHEWQATPDRWEERRAESRKRIVDKFALDRMVSNYEEVWRKVTESRVLERATSE